MKPLSTLQQTTQNTQIKIWMNYWMQVSFKRLQCLIQSQEFSLNKLYIYDNQYFLYSSKAPLHTALKHNPYHKLFTNNVNQYQWTI